uniref:Fatty acid hydroxylase domain-containing protein n=1 Tax=Aplanochytrium stocchinoi TaxID=215587 RepID=A0A7S3PKE1_9STRA
MSHIEHHICKGVYPTTSAAGLWEFYLMGHSITFQFFLYGYPYVAFQMIYTGANIVVHTMWPHAYLLQWHTLHHTVLADVYNVNIPSDYDVHFSKDFKKYDAVLSETSLFVRYKWLSDAFAGLLMPLGVGVYHMMGWGLQHVMKDSMWIPTS